jgi:hypothetical protein
MDRPYAVTGGRYSGLVRGYRAAYQMIVRHKKISTTIM